MFLNSILETNVYMCVCVQSEGSTSNLSTARLDGTDMDLMYDPILKCYYDPKTHKYYEIK
jgi:hypothetical protein